MSPAGRGPQHRVRATYMRGGTSRALFFRQGDLPPLGKDGDRAAWNEIFRAALGSPDPNGRQLDGMGGGISSLSKIAIIGPASRPDADIDYTFAQVGVADRSVSYRGNCGNISSAVGPYAVDEGLVVAAGDRAEIRIHNTNTGKLIVSRFGLVEGCAAVSGSFELQGVGGTGAPVELGFVDPGGASTGRLLPTGRQRDRIDLAGRGAVTVSLVDASNPVVFARRADLGLNGDETPAALSNDRAFLAMMEALRVQGAALMGLATIEEARTTLRNLPLVALVGSDATGSAEIRTQMISTGQPHKATPLTGAMCLAAAAALPDTVVAEVLGLGCDATAPIRIAHPSGILSVATRMRAGPDGLPIIEEAIVYRTARRLMDGFVYVPRGTV